MSKYGYQVCGYINEPEKVEPDGGIGPRTAFQDIPESWVCPGCGTDKDQFEAT